jgi:hypothetical protein
MGTSGGACLVCGKGLRKDNRSGRCHRHQRDLRRECTGCGASINARAKSGKCASCVRKKPPARCEVCRKVITRHKGMSGKCVACAKLGNTHGFRPGNPWVFRKATPKGI